MHDEQLSVIHRMEDCSFSPEKAKVIITMEMGVHSVLCVITSFPLTFVFVSL